MDKQTNKLLEKIRIRELKENNNLLNVEEVASYLGVAKSTVWMYVKQGKFPKIKISNKETKFSKLELDYFIESCRR